MLQLLLRVVSCCIMFVFVFVFVFVLFILFLVFLGYSSTPKLFGACPVSADYNIGDEFM